MKTARKRWNRPLKEALMHPIIGLIWQYLVWSVPYQTGVPHSLPVLFINTTRVKDGNPAVVSNIHIAPNIFNRRVDVAALLPKDQTIRLSTATILGARFPYISPAGRINQVKTPSSPNGTDTTRSHYFVDGGILIIPEPVLCRKWSGRFLNWQLPVRMMKYANDQQNWTFG